MWRSAREGKGRGDLHQTGDASVISDASVARSVLYCRKRPKLHRLEERQRRDEHAANDDFVLSYVMLMCI